MNSTIQFERAFSWRDFLRGAAIAATLLVAACNDDTAPASAIEDPEAATTPFVPQDWQQVLDGLPFGTRDAGSMAVYQGQMWILGGWNYTLATDTTSIYTDVWSSANGVDWQQHASPPWTFGMYTQAISYDNRVLLMGGLKNSRLPNEELSNEIWGTSDGENWTLLGHGPWEPRIGFNLLTHWGSLYLLGGKVHNTPNPEDLRNDVWRSRDGVHWSRMISNAPWQPRAFQCAVDHGGEIWVMGGGDWDAHVALADVWHSTDGVNWQRAPDAPWKGRIWQSCVSYQGAIWLIGGRTLDPINTVDEVWRSTDGVEWELLSQTVRPGARHAAYTGIFQNSIWTIGGSAHNYMQNDIWKYPATH